MIQMVVNDQFFRRTDGALDGVKLLGNVDTRPLSLNHGDDVLQMTMRAFQTVDHVGMHGMKVFFKHVISYPPG